MDGDLCVGDSFKTLSAVPVTRGSPAPHAQNSAATNCQEHSWLHALKPCYVSSAAVRADSICLMLQGGF